MSHMVHRKLTTHSSDHEQLGGVADDASGFEDVKASDVLSATLQRLDKNPTGDVAQLAPISSMQEGRSSELAQLGSL